MVKTFLRKTIGSVPFVGQCFLLSDYLEWARNSGTSEVLYSIINLFEKKKLLVPDFVPRGFEARQEGFRVTAGGVSPPPPLETPDGTSRDSRK